MQQSLPQPASSNTSLHPRINRNLAVSKKRSRLERSSDKQSDRTTTSGRGAEIYIDSPERVWGFARENRERKKEGRISDEERGTCVSSVVVSMCQRDDLRGCEVAFYVHVTRRDPARTFPDAWRGSSKNRAPTRASDPVETRVLSAREKLGARASAEYQGASFRRTRGRHWRKKGWMGKRAEGGGERRGPSLTKGLERDWKIASFSKSWMEEIAESVSFTTRFFSRWSNVATGRRIIKEIYSLTCFFVHRSLSGSSSDWGSRRSN